MTHDEFDSLVERLEREIREQPQWYKVKLLFMALFGYLYILAVLAVLVGAVMLLVAMVANVHGMAYVAGKIGWVLVVLIWVICRSLWITLPAPTGFEIFPDQAPELFRRIGRLQATLRAPSVSSVIIASDFNASISQLPRLGILGWNRNILTIGWPLLLALSADECEAVLAHEFGHLSAAHGRFAAWVYRIRSTWFVLMESLQNESGIGPLLFGRFFNWYAPAFGAYSFVLARRHEFEADRLGASLVGSKTAAQALIGTCIWHTALDELFWKEFQKQSRDVAEPSPDLYRAMEEFFRVPLPPDRVSHWLRMNLQVRTTSDDTHPALKERLEALHVEATAPVPVARAGAREFLLPEVFESMTVQLNEGWRVTVQEAWRQAHGEFLAQKTRLEELRGHPTIEGLPLPEQIEHAFLTEIVEGSHNARPLYSFLFRQHPDHPLLVYTEARLLLEAGEEAGVSLMDKAVDMDPDNALHACELVVRFFIEQERRSEADPWIKRATAAAEMFERDREERQSLPFSDVYQPHRVDASGLSGIIEALRHHPEVGEAFLVQRTLTVRPDRPLFVLGIRLKKKWYQSDGELATAGETICTSLASLSVFPGETSILALHGHNLPLHAIFVAVAGAKLDLT